MSDPTKHLLQRWHDLWQEGAADEKRNRVKMILDGSNVIFFFLYKGDLYGASESGRVTFAKMLDKKDPDNTKGWRKEATWTATNLYQSVDGKKNQTILGEKDLKDIKVIGDKDKVEELLMQHIKH